MSNTTTQQHIISSKLLAHGNNKYSFIVEPLSPGYGYTLGNSLRRILLSSIPGSAVTRISINENITHEYQSIDGVIEDAMEVMLNLKNLRVKLNTPDEKIVLILNKNTSGDVFARDIKPDGAKFEICNPDLYICSLNKDSKLNIEIEVSKGVGYLPLERINLGDNADPRKLLVDALFSPVTNVALKVEDVRVGDMTNFNKLSINFDTDGSVKAEDIINFALDLNIRTLQEIKNTFTEVKQVAAKKVEEIVESTKVAEEKDDTINLPKKVLNILAKHEINTNADLISKKSSIEEMSGLDEKMIASINKYIDKLDK